MLKQGLKLYRRYYSNATNQSYYISTPIFYVNAAPHIGHLYTALIADAISRYQKLLQTQDAKFVRFSTGTDEHGMKVQRAASQQNLPVAEYCRNISSQYRELFQVAAIDYTDFIRTTDGRHIEAVKTFWQQLKSNGSIYLSQYKGWYCLADEMFLNETQIHFDEMSGQRISIESGHSVEWTEEENYMFELAKFKGDILYWLKQKDDRIKPLKFQKILLDMLEEALPDISVSRPASRVHWAIPVPGDSTQTVYVWLDALVNYLTALGYPDSKFRKWWPPQVQVIGKDILKFHGIYWPAFLMAAGLEPPSQLLVHSHWTIDEQKMSKSKNNVVDPFQLAEICSMEGLRYFLLRSGVAHSDGNYNSVKLKRILNAELADTLGNLLSRVCSKLINPKQIYPRLHLAQLRDILATDNGQRLREAVLQLKEKCTVHYNDYNFYLAVDAIISTLHQSNTFFEFSRPWELVSKCNGNDNKRYQMQIPQSNDSTLKLETIIAMTMDTLRMCGIALQPIVPKLSTHLLDKLAVPATERLWQCMDNNFVEVAEGKREPPFEMSLHRHNPILFKRLIVKDEIYSSSKRSNQQVKSKAN